MVEDEEFIEDEEDELFMLPGCMAEEPDVGEPEPEAVGRSVPADGAGWARAGAATNTVANRQAAMCFFSIVVS